MFFSKEQTGLWVVDVQEKLFPLMVGFEEVQRKMCLLLEAAKILNLPLMVTEQYPEGLGQTIEPIKKLLSKDQKIFSKTTFSGYYDPNAKKGADSTHVSCWILMGIEAHICVLQTAKDLIQANKKVAVATDATASRNETDFLSALNEMREQKVRVTTVETLIYELVRDAKAAEFKKLLPFVKQHV